MPTARALALAALTTLSGGCVTNSAGQTIPAPGDPARVVQLHDLQPWIESDPSADPAQLADRFASFVEEFAEPSLAASEGVTTLSGRHLIALARPAQQAWIADLLRTNVQQGFYQLELRMHQLKVSARQLGEIAPAWRTKRGEHDGPYQEALTDQSVAKILRAAETSEDIEVLHAPSLLLNPMTEASLEVGEEISYLKDYAIQEVEGKLTYHPVYDTLLDGLRVRASCGLLNDGHIGVAFDYQERQVERPIPEFATTIGVNNKVKVQLPASASRHLEQKLRLRDGSTTLLATTDGEGPQVMFLVRAALVATK
jgi:hypothetical protein